MKDVVALVTGASRGVGRGIARSLLAEGATVHVTGRTRWEAEASLGGKRRRVGCLRCSSHRQRVEVPGGAGWLVHRLGRQYRRPRASSRRRERVCPRCHRAP
ncbi:SDR family NAD(P)-dependent oxidoreductase [Ensifer sp. 22564]|uniref:SDR family NAD(P)-dependent oxidoreductase n=1 Tax=Ensifer sp. 22564 TaxID=3453943 RepID=UPI003F83A66D